MATFLNNPEWVEVNKKRYKINTDFRIAIECQKIAEDTTIGDFQRAMGILYKLFGEEALKEENSNDWNRLLELAVKYLQLNRENNGQENNEEPDMDFIEDMPYIEASFMSDYKIDLTTCQMHWWKFFKLLEGLSNSETGNCCILNRIRNIRTMDISKIKGSKESQEILKLKEQYALKKNKKPVILTEEQRKSRDELFKIIGIIQ